MDDFDDLLAPSRRVLEDNPFADPFAKRSNSPDPWASPYANSSVNEFNQSTTPTANSYVPTPESYESSNEASITSPTSETDGPLDLVKETTEDDHNSDELPRSTPTSPGFRESIAPAFSEIATIRPTEPEELEPDARPSVESTRSATPVRKETNSPASPTPQHVTQPSRTDSHVVSPSASSSNSKSSNDFVSPLERDGLRGIDNSIAGLSIGGGALGGGWQSEQSAWGGQADDDSDDDKPIGQTLRSPEYNDNKLVCDDAFNTKCITYNTQSDAPPLTRTDSGIQPVFVISVEDPQKVGDPIRSFTMYTVHTRVRIYLSPIYNYLSLGSTDHIPLVPEIGLLCSSAVLGFPLVVRNAFCE